MADNELEIQMRLIADDVVSELKNIEENTDKAALSFTELNQAVERVE